METRSRLSRVFASTCLGAIASLQCAHAFVFASHTLHVVSRTGRCERSSWHRLHFVTLNPAPP